MPDNTAKGRTALIIVSILCATAIGVSFTAGGVALINRANQQDSSRTSQQVFNARITAVSIQDCKEIEKLKTNVREQAIRDFKQLDATLKLLKLQKTPAIFDRALSDMHRTLRIYKAEVCPRPVKPITS